MSVRIQPCGDFVLVRPLTEEAERTSPAGIVMPGVENQDMRRGEVLAIGPLTKKTIEELPVRFLVGATVLFSKHAGLSVVENGETLILVQIGMIAGVVGEIKDE